MNQTQIKAIQTKVLPFFAPADRKDAVDGFFGNKSIAATQKYLRSLMPSPHPWPKSDQASLTAFYGRPGDESKLVNLPVPEGVDLRYEGKTVKTVRIHNKLAKSFARILVQLSKTEDGRAVLADFGGIYNNRPMRGGSTPSLHARGAASDFRAGSNGNLTSWPAKATMPLSVMEIFAREGWLPAGAFWGRDAMHFQATQ